MKRLQQMRVSHVERTPGYKPRVAWAGQCPARKKKPGPASREGSGCAGPGVGTMLSGGDGFLLRLIYRQADQVVEGAQRCLGAFTHRNDDLLVRHGGDVAGCEYAWH